MKVLWEGKNKIWTAVFVVLILVIVFQDQIKALFS